MDFKSTKSSSKPTPRLRRASNGKTSPVREISGSRTRSTRGSPTRRGISDADTKPGSTFVSRQDSAGGICHDLSPGHANRASSWIS